MDAADVVPLAPEPNQPAEACNGVDLVEEPPLEPLQPVVICSEPRLVHVSPTSATLRWSPADWHLPALDERQAEFQQRCIYSLEQGLAVQLVDVGPPTQNTPEEQLLLLVPSVVAEEAWKVVPKTAPPLPQEDGSLQLVVTGLRAGRFYGVKVSAVASVSVDEGPALVFPQSSSNVVAVRTTPTPPGQMQAPALAQRARNALKLKWNVPDESGGESITAFELLVSPQPAGWEGGPPDQQGFSQVYVGDERSYKLGRLGPGQRFQFKIRAFNALGAGPWSLPSTFTTQASVPAQPDPPVQVAASKDSATMQWRAPADNGSLVSCYQLEVDDGRQGDFRLAYTGPEQHCLVQQLQSGLQYRFRLRAENAEGYSLWSAVAAATTAATAPSSPLGLAVVGVTCSAVTLAWQPPAHDGGSPVLAYQVQLQAKTKVAAAALGNDWIIIFEGASTATTFSALQAGCQYMVRVAARNSAGQGQFSLPLQLTTAADTPLAPSMREADIATSSLLLRWAAPAHDGGAAVSGYKVEMRCSPAASSTTAAISPQHSWAIPEHFLCIYSGPDMCVQVTDLLPGTAYEYRAAALNSNGASAWSEVATATTLPAAPLPPPTPQLSASSSSSLTVGWVEPYGQGSPVTSYTLNMARLGAAAGSATASAVMPNANGDAAHLNDTHDDGATSSSSSQTAAAAADKLRWETVYTGPGTSAEVKHLKPASRYQLRVRAHNSIGGSNWGEALTACTAPAAPSQPDGLTAVPCSSHVVQLSWQPPLEDNGAPVTAYQLEVAPVAASAAASSSSSWSKVWHGTELSHEVAGLQPGRCYSWRVRALNSCGAGPWCGAVKGSTLPAEPGPTAKPSIIKREAAAVRVKWGLPLEDNGATVTSFVLALRAAQQQQQQAGSAAHGPADWQVVYSGSDTQHKVTGLQPGCSYELRVAAVNSVGAGPWSEASSVVTQLRPPSPPASLLAELQEQPDAGVGAAAAAAVPPCLLVSWTAAASAPDSAEAVGYEVEATPHAAAAGSTGPAVKANVAKQTSSSISGLHWGVTYNVRVRSVGAEGTGHSSWSNVVTVAVPALPAAPSSAGLQDSSGSGVAASAAALDGPGKKAKQRKGKGSKEAAAEKRRGAAERSSSSRPGATARGPPKKLTKWDYVPFGPVLKKQLKKNAWAVVIGVFGIMVFTWVLLAILRNRMGPQMVA